MTLQEFVGEGLAFAQFWLRHMVRMMYWVWIPGFLLAGILAVRYQARALAVLRGCRRGGWPAIRAGLIAAGLGTACRHHSVARSLGLLGGGVSPQAVLAYWVGSHSVVLYLLVLMTLTIGVEFAAGLLLAGVLAAVLVGTVGGGMLGLAPGPLQSGADRHELQAIRSWKETILRPAGWWAILRYIGREIGGFALPLAWGILLAGFVLPAGLLEWWPVLDEEGGIFAELGSAALAPLATAAVGLSPAGSLPVAASLWKTYTVAFSGLLAFVLGSLLHPLSWRAWCRAVGWRAALRLWMVTLGAGVTSGLAVTGLFALAGFHPSRVPLFRELVDKIIMWLPFTMDQMGPMMGP